MMISQSSSSSSRTALLVFWLFAVLAQIALGQETVSTPARQLPEVKGDTDADIEIKFARGDLKASELCGKLKGKSSRINLGCEKAASIKNAKAVWEKNEESSAWEALSMIDEAKFGKDATGLVNQIMEDALGSVAIESGHIKFGKANQAETTGRLVYACGQLTDCLKRTFTNEERVAIAEYLLSVQPVSGPVALGLKALSDFGMASVTHKQTDKIATVTATSLVGKPLTWKLGKASAPVVSAVSGKPNEIKVEFGSKQGTLAKVPVEIELPHGVKATFNLQFEVSTTFTDAKLTLREKSSIKKELTIGNHPAKFDAAVSLEPGQTLEVTVNAASGSAGFCPEQAVFALISGGNEYQVPSSCSEREIRVSIANTPKFAEELQFQSGSFELVFIASDERMSNPTLWRMGKVQLALSPPPEKKHEPLFTHSLLHESDTTLKPLPEIHHQFRQPDRRAPFILSFVFTCGQIGILVALFAGLLLLGFNPLNILKSVRLLFFSAVLAGTEALFFWYWVGPAGAPNMESLAYKYLPPVILLLYVAERNLFPGGGSKKKNASM